VGASIYRINTNVAFDPDFGKQALVSTEIFRVTIHPADPQIEKWFFYILLPISFEKIAEKDTDAVSDDLMDEDDDEEHWGPLEEAKHICEKVAGKNDGYELVEVNDDDVKRWNHSTPILSYDPNEPDSYLWLSPPFSMKN
jgi:hypothetical protein